MERLSLGTDEAHQKMQQALNNLWRFTAELFELTADEQDLVDSGVLPKLDTLKDEWSAQVESELARLNLTLPDNGAYRRGAKQGAHTEHLGYILAEMQYMQRTYPNMNW